MRVLYFGIWVNIGSLYLFLLIIIKDFYEHYFFISELDEVFMDRSSLRSIINTLKIWMLN